jgi:DNA polymerase III epsilon subunit-like protein
MFLLFLDTETTGVDFASDQIIELGAVIFELDPISLVFSPFDKFQSTVALRQKLDDKISRITGITTEELSTALSATKVQQKWNEWLDKYDTKIEAIIGHSIDFDLHFLKKEGWFLPTDKNIDTLSLSKILFPNLSAINQEFLSKKLKFETKIPFTDLENLTHHRSLYDSIMCANLFGVILKEIKELKCSSEFIKYFTTNFLDLGMQFYPKPMAEAAGNTSKPKTQNCIVTISGKKKELSQGEKISNLGFDSLSKIEQLLEIKLSSSLKLVLAQIYILNLRNIEGLSNLKFHAQGGNFWSYNFFNLVVEYITESKSVESPKTIITKYETIIDQLSQVLDHSVNLGQIIEHLEILNQILIANDINSKMIQSVLSQYDFLLFALQPLLQNNELKLALTSPNYHQRNFVTKLESLIIGLDSLETDLLNEENLKQVHDDNLKNLILFIRSQIKSQVDTIYFDNNAFYSFRVSGKYLTLTRPKKNFDLNSNLETLLNSKPLIQTYLSEQGFLKLNELANLNIGEQNYELEPAAFDYEFEKLNNIDGLEYLQSKLEIAKSQKKIVIIMCGLNSSMNNLQKFILQDDTLTRNSLIVGESGSLTKIASKIEQGFTGLVIVKFSSLNYFVHENNQRSDVAEVVIYDKPYFNIHNYWYNLAKQSNDETIFLNQIKELHLQAKVNFIHQQTGAKVEFVWNLG